jgi:hypothetical protein
LFHSDTRPRQVEPRCTVGAVEGSLVSLKQADNTSCFWRLYYFGIGWGGATTGDTVILTENDSTDSKITV